MQNEKELPIGFKKLSDRYDCFPILLRGGKSLLSMDRRPSWKWKWKLLLLAQIEEATGKNAPSWLGQVNTWQLTLIDGRRYLLTSEEKEAYMNFLALHDTVMKWSYGAEKMQSASKIGG